ncbi:U-box/RING-like domain protein [Plodia interpunctella granulovirus]|uniref:U-box/RING-like domain protein n=1 Tax=Plodia interpunctella granulovirus TaxID=262175 RepID=A0A1L5JGS8_9BBAC|nr:U-box/RING-like domain protein [Plodia interpunctella granulovirus]APO14001.1 U-box/RING-like domain protein [Plodia interpunctella granulovirus]
MFTITTNGECKKSAEAIIRQQFPSLECAICLMELDNTNKGVVYITCGGTADLERIMCRECDKKFEKHDPYKRDILYRFGYPFVSDEHAKQFLERSKNFVLNEGEEEKIEKFSARLKSTACGYRDIDFQISLNI